MPGRYTGTLSCKFDVNFSKYRFFVCFSIPQWERKDFPRHHLPGPGYRQSTGTGVLVAPPPPRRVVGSKLNKFGSGRNILLCRIRISKWILIICVCINLDFKIIHEKIKQTLNQFRFMSDTKIILFMTFFVFYVPTKGLVRIRTDRDLNTRPSFLKFFLLNSET